MPRTAVSALLLTAAAACGGTPKATKQSATPAAKPGAKPLTEADREATRQKAAREIIAEGATCAPAELKGSGDIVLQLGTAEKGAVLCAVDAKQDRWLGPIACWTVNASGGELTYQAPAPLPGVPFQVKLDGRCARGRCLPEEADVSAGNAWMAWNNAGDSVVLAGDVAYVFAADGAAKGSIMPRDTNHADKALVGDITAAAFVGDVLFVAGGGDGGGRVFAFKTDGTAVGVVERLGSAEKGPATISSGSLAPYSPTQVAVLEGGLTSLLTVEAGTQKRAKLVRKPPKTVCKPKELAAFRKGGEFKVGAKCDADLKKHFEPYVGAMVVAGPKHALALLRGSRDGAIVKLDAKTLVETAEFPEPWCAAAEAPAAKAPAE